MFCTSCKNTQSESFYITNENLSTADSEFLENGTAEHIHKYNNPTCTEPAICSICKAVVMTADGHRFKKATCTEPKTCTVCNYTEGEPLGHHFVDGCCIKCLEEEN